MKRRNPTAGIWISSTSSRERNWWAVGALERMTEVVEARPEGDIWLHRGPVDYVTIGQGRFVAVWPGDAHAPGIAPDGVPKHARKCVVKVLV